MLHAVRIAGAACVIEGAMTKMLLAMLPLAFVAAVASANDDGPVRDTGSCALPATWTGSYSCPALHAKPYTWIIHPNGTASGTIDNRIPIRQTWSLSGTTVTINDVGSSCAGAGKYTLSFSDDCSTMTLKRQSDACPSRGDCVDGLTSTRQR